ncbi:hypothetical protein [Marispirochaeta aestuarii]|uniref:Uncharacterized protein n=1 Tax=Marispirochaeta aestuarii TaxID=1963862 RepID=A0A1Y1S090_9SPIO|nr:hypothetical protein [Marispirochaeta aestuarii]ORC36561.1 hypothetical protein B4O97_05680 [Marispirochaeta aestuarii]
MKKQLVLVIAVLLLTLFAVSAVADESEFFFKSLPITRVYAHRDGYRIIYRRTNMELADMYVPVDWFQYEPGAGNRGKGELVMDENPAFPYFSIFWKNGEFSHVRLYLREDKNHLSWGIMRNPEAYADRFDVETLDDLQF